jgi:NDP-sugar pyrophosphorylase family protein
VVILAAGHGMRMLPLTKDIPKPLIFLNDKPIIHHILDNFAFAGFNDFIIVVGHLGFKIENYLKERVGNMNIRFIEQKAIIGTGKATLIVEDLVGNQPFFLTYADVLCDFRIYKEMLQKFVKLECA